MWFSKLLYPHAAVDTWHDKALAVPADLTPVLSWQANLCPHGYFSGSICILLSQHWVFIKGFHGQAEKRLNALPRYTPSIGVHSLPFSIESLRSPLTYLPF
jgi:hypothetical protein